MKASKLAVGALCVTMALGVPSAAWAQTWFKSFDVGSLHTEGEASYDGGFGPNAGLRMGPTDDSSFTAAFTLPPEYRPGQTLYVGIIWHTDSASPCSISLAPDFLSVARIGSTHIMNQNASGGLEPLDGSTVLTATATNTTGLKIYTITSPDENRNLQFLDSITFGLFRRPSENSDTCGAGLIIQGIAVAIVG